MPPHSRSAGATGSDDGPRTETDARGDRRAVAPGPAQVVGDLERAPDGALLVGLVRDRYPETGGDFCNSSAQQLAAVVRDGRCDHAMKFLLDRRSHFRVGLLR